MTPEQLALVKALAGNELREPLASFEEAWASWQKAIGMQRERYKPTRRAPAVGTKKIVVIPDIHAPFHEEGMLAALIARESDADMAVCIGDISDAYSLSTFTKYRAMPFSEEWASVTAVMQAISEAFPEVQVIIGNHDARLEKRLRERLSEDMVDAVRYLAGGVLCPLTALAKRYPNVTVANHELSNGDSADWFTTIGDAWFGHPERYSRVPGSALRSVDDWLADHEDDLELGRFRLICMGHTHTASMFPWRNRQLLVECGALCQTQGYMLKPKIGGRPQIRGYLTLTQHDGVTDLNSVRFIWLDQDRTYGKDEDAGRRPARVTPATTSRRQRQRT
jgi:UDP-2,3-diacylglucosamine pyrophosphatase LpxH